MPIKKEFFEKLYTIDFNNSNIDIENIDMNSFVMVGDNNWDYYFSDTPPQAEFEILRNVYILSHSSQNILSNELSNLSPDSILDTSFEAEKCFAVVQ